MSRFIKVIAVAAILTISFGTIVQAQEPREVPEGVVEIFDGQPTDGWYTLQLGETLIVQTEELGVYLFGGDGSTKAILAAGSFGNQSIVVTSDDFIPVDAVGRVTGLEDVYAAGDITTFPVKQGGLAAQEADVAAARIAADAGADVAPQTFEPVLRGLLLSGSPLYFRAEVSGGRGPASTADPEPLWWPAAKIASRYLSPYLAEHAGLAYGRRGGPASLLQ